jgi:peptidoglycan hydrolase-like protein with peptidoglycan-binding domain
MELPAREVMAIEISLDKQGFHPGEVDGVLDNQTEQAIAGFQKQNNLPVTGMLDEQTANQLEIASNSQSQEWSGKAEAVLIGVKIQEQKGRRNKPWAFIGEQFNTIYIIKDSRKIRRSQKKETRPKKWLHGEEAGF